MWAGLEIISVRGGRTKRVTRRLPEACVPAVNYAVRPRPSVSPGKIDDGALFGNDLPFSQRCRLVLFEKGMDFEIKDVDLFKKPEDINVMNPYGQVPILVERDLTLYESNIINEYIDERFPHPQLMPADPVMRARARLFLFNFERELFVHVQTIENTNNQKAIEKGKLLIRDRLTQLAPILLKSKYMLGDEFLDAGRRDRAAAVAPGPLRHRSAQERCAADEVRRAHLQPPGYIEALTPSEKVMRR